jgi:hypothetical protein
MLVRVVVACSLAIALAIPALFEQAWHAAPRAIVLLNCPAIFCGLLFGGRFFPPEGYIGQSIPRWILMVLVQALVWYSILWLFHLVIVRSKRPQSDATRSI